MTEFHLVRTPFHKVDCDAVALGVVKGVDLKKQMAGPADALLGGPIADLLRRGDFRAKAKEARVLPTMGKFASPRVIVMGLGPAKEFDLERIRDVSARAALVARDHRFKRVALPLWGAGSRGIDAREAAQAIAEGVELGLFEFREFKPQKPRGDDEEPHVTVEQVQVVEPLAARRGAATKGLHEGGILAQSTNLTRTLIIRPSLAKAPETLAEVARSEAKKVGIHCEVHTPADLEKLGMGALLGVGSGSARPPRLVVLEYKGGKKKVLLCGKGIVFDSGGINIKPSEGMERMKYDMAGSATVLGTILAAARLKLKVHVVAIMALAENMPSGSAIRPGDVLVAYNKKTIEVANTDAEGRLVLADALSYGVKRFEPDLVVDVATLTGAARVALGNITTAVMGSDNGLVQALVRAGRRTGDDLWQLPLHAGYEKQVRSEIAEVKNVGAAGSAGAIAGAAFLKQFVDGRKWAHLDIAGTCWTEKGPADLSKDYLPKGPTGIGVRLFVEWLRSLRP